MFCWFDITAIFSLTIIFSTWNGSTVDVISNCCQNKSCYNINYNNITVEFNKKTLSTSSEQFQLERRKREEARNSVNSTDYMEIPKFHWESGTVVPVLDYILVNWIFPLNQIISMREGRMMLRRYTKEALELLLCAFSQHDPHDFRFLVRIIWTHRAQYLFDNHHGNELFPYFPHFYTSVSNITQPHIVRSLYDIHLTLLAGEHRTWRERNPPASKEDVNEILNVHIPGSSGAYDHEIFSEYARRGMRKADYYFEKHNDQFYRIIFFILELRARGIVNDEQDLYNGPLPFDVVPPEIQAILYSDDLYSIYLLRLKEAYGDIRGDQLRKNIAMKARVCEEDLILLLLKERPTKHIYYIITNPKFTTIPTTSTSAPIESTTTEFPEDKKGKRGRLFICHCGSHFTKKSTASFPDSCCFHQNADSSNHDDLTESCLKHKYNYNVTSSDDLVFSACAMLRKAHVQESLKTRRYGFITFNPMEFPAEKSFFITEILQDSTCLKI